MTTDRFDNKEKHPMKKQVALAISCLLIGMGTAHTPNVGAHGSEDNTLFLIRERNGGEENGGTTQGYQPKPGFAGCWQSISGKTEFFVEGTRCDDPLPPDEREIERLQIPTDTGTVVDTERHFRWEPDLNVAAGDQVVVAISQIPPQAGQPDAVFTWPEGFIELGSDHRYDFNVAIAEAEVTYEMIADGVTFVSDRTWEKAQMTGFTFVHANSPELTDWYPASGANPIELHDPRGWDSSDTALIFAYSASCLQFGLDQSYPFDNVGAEIVVESVFSFDSGCNNMTVVALDHEDQNFYEQNFGLDTPGGRAGVGVVFVPTNFVPVPPGS